MTKHRVLLVDDNEDIREIFQEGLEKRGFEVVPSANVSEALKLIVNEHFDVLLSDLHMPDPGDGFTVVSAMRHTHPMAVTVVMSGYPALQESMNAILSEADEVLAKPVVPSDIFKVIEKQLAHRSPRVLAKKERVAVILQRDADYTIRNWLSRVESNAELSAIPLNFTQRTGHLPLILGDLVRRLRLAPNSPVSVSESAQEHGRVRREQGYTVPMMVEESRNLRVSIFNTLQNNLGTADFSTLLLDVMTIADEVYSQLKQSLIGHGESLPTPSGQVSTLESRNVTSNIREAPQGRVVTAQLSRQL